LQAALLGLRSYSEIRYRLTSTPQSGIPPLRLPILIATPSRNILSLSALNLLPLPLPPLLLLLSLLPSIAHHILLFARIEGL
jgi:hypothetical protein